MNKEIYLKLHNEVKTRDYSKFYKKLEEDFGTSIPNEIHDFIHDLALKTQITIKPSKMLYLHGFVLYISLKSYILKYQEKNQENEETQEKNKPITIIETGTAKGFSSLIMAKTLEEMNQEGTIHTIDIIPPDKPIIRNTIDDLNKYPKTLYEILEPEPYKKLYQKYIKFHHGDSKDIITEIINTNTRVNFAFLDAHHTYINLTNELNLIIPHQNPEDIIICDDYTIYLKPQNHLNPQNPQNKYQYPGIIQALKEFIIKNPNYSNHIYYGNDGEKLRGYVVLKNNK